MSLSESSTMSPLKAAPSDEMLLVAVEMRVGGLRWEHVAERLRRSAETVRKWPMRYPERWQAAASAAERRMSVDSQGEAVLVLRNLLRDKDTKVQWHAANSLINMRLGINKLELRALLHAAPGEPADKAKLLKELLEDYTDEHLVQLANEGFGDATSRDASPASAVPTSAA
jgi:transposase